MSKLFTLSLLLYTTVILILYISGYSKLSKSSTNKTVKHSLRGIILGNLVFCILLLSSYICTSRCGGQDNWGVGLLVTILLHNLIFMSIIQDKVTEQDIPGFSATNKKVLIFTASLLGIIFLQFAYKIYKQTKPTAPVANTKKITIDVHH